MGWKKDIVGKGTLPVIRSFAVEACTDCPMAEDGAGFLWCMHPATDGGARIHTNPDTLRPGWCPLNRGSLTITAADPDTATAAEVALPILQAGASS